VAERALVLNRITGRIMDNLELLAVAETWDNAKSIGVTLAADIPPAADHFRYLAGAIDAGDGSLSQIDDGTTAYRYQEPLASKAKSSKVATTLFPCHNCSNP
jgi:aldehyde dehydrogenase